jgi:hypothetical protein
MTGTIAAILALSLVVWVLFYLATPGTPLAGAETIIVVGVCGAVVLAAKWIWARLVRTRGKNGEGS